MDGYLHVAPPQSYDILSLWKLRFPEFVPGVMTKEVRNDEGNTGNGAMTNRIPEMAGAMELLKVGG
jgi:hypothetical protein